MLSQTGPASGTVYRGWTKEATLDVKAVIQRLAVSANSTAAAVFAWGTLRDICTRQMRNLKNL